MARSGNPRHSGSTRKPTIIDHEPVKKDGVPAAEPVGMKPSSAAQNAETVNKRQDRSQSDKAAPPSAGGEKRGRGSGFAGSIIGGVAVVAVAGALQWAGVLPQLHADGQKPAITLSSKLEDELAALKTEITTLKAQTRQSVSGDKTAPSVTSFNDADRTALHNTAVMAQAAHNTAEATARYVENVAQDVKALSGSLTGIKAEMVALQSTVKDITTRNNADDANKQKMSEMAAHYADIESHIGVLSQTVETLKGQLAGLENNVQQFAGINEKIAQSEMALKQNATALSALSATVSALPNPKDAKIEGMAVLIAANALKNAVDRGGSYLNELHTFEAIAPKSIDLAPLKAQAATGIPTAGELSEQFTKVADSIAATEISVPDDAGYGEKLWAAARGLVSTRPVGDVEGSDAAAVAARMEVAIKGSDFERALAEWQALPPSAKAVSQDFVASLKARNDVEHLLVKLVALSLASDTSSGEEEDKK